MQIVILSGPVLSVILSDISVKNLLLMLSRLRTPIFVIVGGDRIVLGARMPLPSPGAIRGHSG